MDDTAQRDVRAAFRIAGAAALGAGTAWAAWVTLNAVTHGALDAGPPAASATLTRVGALLMVGWNLLLIPAALALYALLQSRGRERARLYAVCGIASLLFWAYGGATRSITPVLEASYLLLSGVWWLGVGLDLRAEHRILGWYTAVLGGFTLLDAACSAVGSVPFWLYLTAAPKLPLSIVWDFWLGVMLLKRGADDLRRVPYSQPIQPSSVSP